MHIPEYCIYTCTLCRKETDMQGRDKMVIKYALVASVAQLDESSETHYHKACSVSD